MIMMKKEIIEFNYELRIYQNFLQFYYAVLT